MSPTRPLPRRSVRARPPRRRRGRRRLVVLWVALVITAGLGVNVTLALRPAAVESRLREGLSRYVRGPFEMEACRVSPRRGIEVVGLRLLRPVGGSRDVLRIGRASIVPRIGAALLGRFEAARVELDGVEIDLSRDAAGRWNFEDVLRPPAAREPREEGDERSPRPPVRWPDVVLRGGTLRVRDAATGSEPLRQDLRDLRLSIRRLASGDPREAIYALDGEFGQDLARRVAISGRVRHRRDGVGLDGTVRIFKLDLARACRRFLTGDGARMARELRPAGLLDVEAGLRLDSRDGFRVDAIRASLVGGSAAPSGLPWELGNLRGNAIGVGQDSTRLRVELSGELGSGSVRLTGQGSFDPRTLVFGGGALRLEVRHLTVDPRMTARVTGLVQRALELCRPRGRVDLDLDVPLTGLRWPRLEDVEARVVVAGTDFQLRPFPYPLTDARGEIVLREGSLRLRPGARVRCGEGTIRLDGPDFRIDLAGSGEVAVKLHLESFALDDRLRDAIPARHRHIWDDLSPGGTADGEVEISRPPRAPGVDSGVDDRLPTVVVRARARQGRIQYRHFPYAIEEIDGEALFDTRDWTVRMIGLEGRHGRHRIHGDGTVRLRRRDGEDAGGRQRDTVQLRLSCDDLTVDEDLLAAMPGPAQRVLRDFRFQGRVRLDEVAIDTTDRRNPVAVAFELLEARASHVDFPYAFDLGGGKFEYRGLDSISLRGWRSPEGAKPGIEFDGDVNAAEQPCVLDYRLRVSELKVDDRLLEALPSSLSELVRGLKLAGTFGGRLDIRQEISRPGSVEDRIDFVASEVVGTGAAMRFGLDVVDVSCRARFRGAYRAGRATIEDGVVDLVRGRFNRLRLGDGRIRFAYGAPLAPAVSRGSEAASADEPRLPAEYLRDLRERDGAGLLQMSVESEDFYGGPCRGFLHVDTGERADFAGRFKARRLDVRQAATDVFGVTSDRVSGRAGGEVEFRGRLGDVSSIEGRGKGEITGARLAELPVFFHLFRLFHLDFDSTTGTTFHVIRLPYTIGKERFRSDAIEMESGVMTLSGGGTLDFSGRLDLRLQPSFLPVSIPGLDEIFALIKEVLSEVHVSGDLARPRVEFETAAGLLPIRIDSRDGGESAGSPGGEADTAPHRRGPQ